MNGREAIDVLCRELGVVDRSPFGPQREESLLIDFIDAMHKGGVVTNAEAKREFLLTFEEPVYYEENFYCTEGAEDSYERVRAFAAMEPVVPVKLTPIGDMNLDD